jgi:hypothetical protein
MFFAWMIGESIIAWRWAKAKAPPTPGELLLPSGLFLGLAILSEYRPARPVAVTFAFAVDLAILLQVVGNNPTAKTGWPPPKMNADQIWPSASASAAPAAASGGTSAAQKAANGSGISGDILNILSEAPGIGIIK